jgi:hypothetical protein
MLATAADEGNHCHCRGRRGNSCGDSQRDPPKAKGSVEEQPQPEQQEQHTGEAVQEVLGQALMQHRTHRDGYVVGQHRARRGTDPDACPVVITGQGDCGEHRLVAEFSKYERGDNGEQDVSRLGDPNRAFRATNQIVRKSLCRKQHGQDSGVGMADRVDADTAHHRRHRSVGLRLDPCGSVLQAKVG